MKKVEKKVLNGTFEELVALLNSYQVENSSIAEILIDGFHVVKRYVLVTPEVAERFLERNIKNRGLSKRNVDMYSRQMKLGLWRFDGTPIAFNSKGELCNGQHRLNAIIKSGVSAIFEVTTGLDPEVFKTMDTGKKRDGSDAFSIEGIPNSTCAATSTKFIASFKGGRYSAANCRMAINNEELINYYYMFKGLDESVKFGKRLSQSCKDGLKIMTPGLLSSFHYLFSEKDSELATEFLTKMYLGTDLDVNSPIFKLRANLIKSKTSNTYSLSDLETVRQVVYTWNRVRAGKSFRTLRVPENWEVELK